MHKFDEWIDVAPEEVEAESLVNRLSEIMYQLFLDGQSGAVANRLENERNDFFEHLYTFSYGVPSYNILDKSVACTTDTIALQIIYEKERYNRKISVAEGRYARFKRLIEVLPEPEATLIVGYFERNQKVDYEALLNCVVRNLDYLEQFYMEVEKQKHKAALQGLGRYLRQK